MREALIQEAFRRLVGPAIAMPAVLLTAAVLAANLNVLSAGFVWDDHAVILGNALIKQWSTLPAVFADTFLQSYYRPIITFSFAADYAVWGKQPFGYHLVNLILHVLNVWLVFSILKRISGSLFAAFVGGLLFAVHPAHKGIAYISDRTGLLAGFFFLASVLFYLSYRDSKAQKRAWLHYAGAVVFCGLASFSKEEALTLPLVLVMTDVFFFPHILKKEWARQLARYLPFFFLPALYIYIRAHVVEAPMGMADAFLIEPIRRLMTIPSLLLDYLLLLVFPVQVDYDARIRLVDSIWEIRAWVGIVAIASALAISVWLFKKNRPVSFGILWFFIVFLPMSNLIPIFADVAETELFAPVHFLYLPSVGVFLCAGIGLDKAFSMLRKADRLQKKVLCFGILLITMSFCLLSLRRNIVWKDEINFHGYVARMHPERVSHRPHLARAYLSKGDVESAIRILREAVALDPDSFSVRKGLGVAYLHAGLVGPAIREFQMSVSLKPDDADSYANLAVAYVEKGALAEAIRANAKAVELAPSVAHLHANFGLVLIRAGDYEKAEEHFRIALSLSPDDAESRENLDWLLDRKKPNPGAATQPQRLRASQSPIENSRQQDVGPDGSSRRSTEEGKPL